MSDSIVLHGAEDVRVEAREVPEPGPGEVLLRVAFGGVCGSDLHYVHHGRGSFSIVREPLVLGHEVSAVVAALGPGVDSVAVGAHVAVNPAKVCGRCADCRAGHPQVCANVRYLGSAVTLPHVQGALTEWFVTDADLVHPLPEGVDLATGALAEPFAVAVHAVRRAGNVAGARVLVAGAGPVGLLLAAAARAAGAAHVTVTDLHATALTLAREIGVDRAIDVSTPEGAAEVDGLAGAIDIAFDASGAARGLATCIRSARRRGVVVQVGMLPMGDTPVDIGELMSREVDLRTSLRFGNEFPEAVRLLGVLPQLRAMITSIVPLADAEAGFAAASDRSAQSKVLFDLGAGA